MATYDSESQFDFNDFLDAISEEEEEKTEEKREPATDPFDEDADADSTGPRWAPVEKRWPTVDVRPPFDYTDDNMLRVYQAIHRRFVDTPTGPQLFSYGGQSGEPSRIAAIEALGRPGRLTIREIKKDTTLETYLAKLKFVRQEEQGKGQEKRVITPEKAPPEKIVKHLLDSPDAIQLPPLRGVTRLPVIARDGSIATAKGYDPKTSLYLDPLVEIEPIPDRLTAKDVAIARAEIDYLFDDFPFVHEGFRAAATSLLVTATCRHMIDGPVPMYVSDAPDHGTGKSLLIQFAVLVLQGENYSTYAWTNDRIEANKMLLPAIGKGDPYLFFDNVDQVIDSTDLARAVTSANYSSRVLGISENKTVPNMSVCCFSMNRGHVSDEIARRTVMIQLDKRYLRPDQVNAKGERVYKHAGSRFARAPMTRARIVRAILILTRAWLQAGEPRDLMLKPLESFEEWSRIVGGILRFAGYQEFHRAVYVAAESFSRDRAWADQVKLALWEARHTVPAHKKEIGEVIINAGLFGYELLKVRIDANPKSMDPKALGAAVINNFEGLLMRWPTEVEPGVMIALRKVEKKDRLGQYTWYLEVTEGQEILDARVVTSFDDSDLVERAEFAKTIAPSKKPAPQEVPEPTSAAFDWAQFEVWHRQQQDRLNADDTDD